MSRSSRARGLKLQPATHPGKACRSRSSRARGLKPSISLSGMNAIPSRSSRARGLKRSAVDLHGLAGTVALFTAAWIETCGPFGAVGRNVGGSRSSRARGLKRRVAHKRPLPRGSRSSRARGLKRDLLLAAKRHRRSRSSRACGLKQTLALMRMPLLGVALFAGAWIETPGRVQSSTVTMRRALRGRVSSPHAHID